MLCIVDHLAPGSIYSIVLGCIYYMKHLACRFPSQYILLNIKGPSRRPCIKILEKDNVSKMKNVLSKYSSLSSLFLDLILGTRNYENSFRYHNKDCCFNYFESDGDFLGSSRTIPGVAQFSHVISEALYEALRIGLSSMMVETVL